jgi:hypothetical protein
MTATANTVKPSAAYLSNKTLCIDSRFVNVPTGNAADPI